MSTYWLAVLGNPVVHSRSPEIHAHFARQSNIRLNYEKILVPAGQFAAVADSFLETGTGLNVTLPCKGDAFRYVDHASERASLAQAVNTVSRGPGGGLQGDNTDGPGLVTDIRNNLGWPIAGSRLLVLGAGGAVSGVLGSLLDESPGSIDLFNRTGARAVALAERMGSPLLRAVDEASLGEAYDLVINGTSTGLTGDEIRLPHTIVDGHTRCYDMVYSHDVTAFNRWCLGRANCETADGLGMLVEQAALSFSIWFDRQVETGGVIEALRTSLS